MDVTRTAERDLTDTQKAEVLALQQLAFPGTEEFPTQRWWHTPLDDGEEWIGARRDGRLIASVRLIFRTIITDAGELLVGGVGNVCSHPDFRGFGAAKACMRAAQETIAAETDFGLLMTGTGVKAFYESLDWHVVDNHMVHRHTDGRDAPGHNSPGEFKMIYPGRLALGDWPAGTINLNGPDW